MLDLYVLTCGMTPSAFDMSLNLIYHSRLFSTTINLSNRDEGLMCFALSNINLCLNKRRVRGRSNYIIMKRKIVDVWKKKQFYMDIQKRN